METPTASRSRSTETCVLKVPSVLRVKAENPKKVLLKIMALANVKFPVFSILPLPQHSIYSSTGNKPLTGLGQKLLLRNLMHKTSVSDALCASLLPFVFDHQQNTCVHTPKSTLELLSGP